MKKTIIPAVLCAVTLTPALAQQQDHKDPMPDLNEVNMPLFQTESSADPAPIVVGDTLFLFTS